jgi:hypothetical protein
MRQRAARRPGRDRQGRLKSVPPPAGRAVGLDRSTTLRRFARVTTCRRACRGRDCPRRRRSGSLPARPSGSRHTGRQLLPAHPESRAIRGRADHRPLGSRLQARKRHGTVGELDRHDPPAVRTLPVDPAVLASAHPVDTWSSVRTECVSVRERGVVVLRVRTATQAPTASQVLSRVPRFAWKATQSGATTRWSQQLWPRRRRERRISLGADL